MTQASHFEITTITSGDAKRLALPDEGRERRFAHRWDDVTEFAEPPILVWTWMSSHELSDYVITIKRERVMSTRMADVLREHASPADLERIQWLPGQVNVRGEVTVPVEVPHIISYPDIYDDDATDWGAYGMPIRWVLSHHKCKDLTLFARPRSSGSLIVSASVLAALKAANITGLRITRARMTPPTT